MGFQALIGLSANSLRARHASATTLALLVILAGNGAFAQAAMSAAERAAPGAELRALAAQVPADSSVIVAGDLPALYEAFVGPFAPFAPAEPVIRDQIRNSIRDSFASEHFDLLAANRLVLAADVDADSAIVFTDSQAIRGALQHGTVEPLGRDMRVARTTLGAVVGNGPMFDAARSDGTTRLALSDTWPAAAEVISHAELGFVYVSSPDVMEEVDDVLRGAIQAAGVRRVAAAATEAGEVWVALDGESDAISGVLGRMYEATVDASQGEPFISQAFVRAAIAQMWQHAEVSRHADGSTLLHLPAPTCGGPLQQGIANVVIAFAWRMSAQSPSVPGALPEHSAPAACPAPPTTSPALPWPATGLVEGEPSAGFLADVAYLAEAAGPTIGGAFPYPVAAERMRELMDPLRAGTWAAGLDYQDRGELRVASATLSELAPDLALGNHVEGVGWVSGALAETLRAPADDDTTSAFIQRLQAATPEDSAWVAFIDEARVQEALDRAPPMLQGALTEAARQATGMLAALNEGRLIVRLLDVPAEQVEDIESNLRAMVRDGMSIASSLPNRGAMFLPNGETAASWFEVASFDGGVEVRLTTDLPPLIWFAGAATLVRGSVSPGP